MPCRQHRNVFLPALLSRAIAVIAVIAGSALVSPVLVAQVDAPPAPALPSLIRWIDEYTTDGSDLRSYYTIRSSPTTRARLQLLDKEWITRLATLDQLELSTAERIDQLLLKSFIQYRLSEAARGSQQLDALAPWFDFAETIQDLEEGRWTLQAVAPQEAATRLDALAQRVEELTDTAAAKPAKSDDDDENRDDGDDENDDENREADSDDSAAPALDPVAAERLADEISNLQDALETWYEHDAAFRPGFSWWVEQPYERANAALDSYSSTLREDIAGQKGEPDDPLVGDPIGADGLASHLAHEFLPYSAAQLLTIGEAEFAWCEQRMLQAAATMGFGDDWQAALAAVKDMHVEPGEQDELVMAQAQEAIRFLDERELVTIPPLARETWRVRMLSAERQKVLPFAAYNRQHMLIAFATNDMDMDARLQAMRGNNEHFSRIVTPHELIPGHHLQLFMAARHNVHRRRFSTPFYVEGWALYWEMLLWDQGWARSPEDRVGMLFWRMHRAARIVVSLRFHLGTMSPPEMIDYLVDRVGHERDNATAEVRRYIGGSYSPLYQCGYMIGGLQLRALANELVASPHNSGTFTLREFHDAVLRCGPIPIELVRASLTNTTLSGDHQASWLFAGDVIPTKSDER
ncbi:MAG: hypothetical protein ACI9EF_002530 [Pseudohongiellaceae bacterium]|jgi:hypothetical protein